MRLTSAAHAPLPPHPVLRSDGTNCTGRRIPCWKLHCLRILFSVPTSSGRLGAAGGPRAPLPPHPVLRSDTTGVAYRPDAASLHCLRILFSVPTLLRGCRLSPVASLSSTASASCSPFRRAHPLAVGNGRTAPLPPHPVLRSDGRQIARCFLMG